MAAHVHLCLKYSKKWFISIASINFNLKIFSKKNFNLKINNLLQHLWWLQQTLTSSSNCTFITLSSMLEKVNIWLKPYRFFCVGPHLQLILNTDQILRKRTHKFVPQKKKKKKKNTQIHINQNQDYNCHLLIGFFLSSSSLCSLSYF